MSTNIMALYNDSDSDSDNEFFTNGHQRLTRNSNFALRPKMYEEEQKAELVYTKDTKKFNPYNIMFDDNESIGSALDIPKRVKQSTNMDEVDSDNDFEPTMIRKKLVIATDDDIENFLDGNPVGTKDDISGELDDYGSVSDAEGDAEMSGSEGEGTPVRERGYAGVAPNKLTAEEKAEAMAEYDRRITALAERYRGIEKAQKIKELKAELKAKLAGKSSITGKGKEQAKATVRQVLEKVRSAKNKVKGAKVRNPPVIFKRTPLEAPMLRDAVDILSEAQPKADRKVAEKILDGMIAEAVEKTNGTAKKVSSEVVNQIMNKASQKAVKLGREKIGNEELAYEVEGIVSLQQEIKELQAKPIPADPAEAKALKKAIAMKKGALTRLNTAMKRDGAPLFVFGELSEVYKSGEGGSYRTLKFRDQELTPEKSTAEFMTEALSQLEKAPASEEKKRLVSVLKRNIGIRKRGDKTNKYEMKALKKEEAKAQKEQAKALKALSPKAGGGSSKGGASSKGKK